MSISSPPSEAALRNARLDEEWRVHQLQEEEKIKRWEREATPRSDAVLDDFRPHPQQTKEVAVSTIWALCLCLPAAVVLVGLLLQENILTAGGIALVPVIAIVFVVENRLKKEREEEEV